MRMPRLYGGLRLTRRGIRPYLGLRLFSIPIGRHQASKQPHTIYHCSRCGALCRPGTDRYCRKCGARFVP
jgi:hypothetical protein